jgi:phosphopantetheinyl transferase (holo-ACP synthase)
MLKKINLPFFKELREGWTEAYVNPEWGSGHQGHREKIRVALEHQLSTNWAKDVSYSEYEALKDLDRIPSFKKIHVSISHGQDLGGFVISKKPVGFDLELKDRIHEKIVRRISLEREVAEAPSLAHLWAAKEATFKALREFAQPGVISELEIGAWKDDHFKLVNEKLFRVSRGHGVAWIDGTYIFSIFII